ncbi:carotenoid cleavage dioxygenase [Tanacetum coccineum]
MCIVMKSLLLLLSSFDHFLVSMPLLYIYCGVGDPMPKISGVVKLDISLSEVDRRECIVASRMFGPGCFGGEPFFVAKEPENPDAAEDEGY